MARPRKTKPASRIDDALIDHLFAGRLSGAGLIGVLKKRLAERLLATELDVHLADPDQVAAGNHRNGTSVMTVQVRISPKSITRFGPKRSPVSVHGDQPVRRMSITGRRTRTRG
jgi:hypothetical protein